MLKKQWLWNQTHSGSTPSFALHWLRDLRGLPYLSGPQLPQLSSGITAASAAWVVGRMNQSNREHHLVWCLAGSKSLCSMVTCQKGNGARRQRGAIARSTTLQRSALGWFSKVGSS